MGKKRDSATSHMARNGREGGESERLGEGEGEKIISEFKKEKKTNIFVASVNSGSDLLLHLPFSSDYYPRRFTLSPYWKATLSETRHTGLPYTAIELMHGKAYS